VLLPFLEGCMREILLRQENFLSCKEGVDVGAMWFYMSNYGYVKDILVVSLQKIEGYVRLLVVIQSLRLERPQELFRRG